VLARLCRRRADAHDALQETFLAAYASLAQFREASTLRTWLTGIAVRQARRAERRSRLPWRWFERSAARDASPGEQAIEAEEATRVRRAVDSLPIALREPVVLHYLEGMTVQEVAELLGISRGAVDVRLHRARRALEARLGGET
jgi:RNA polymerase sigma-70 factor (ECF subfamily)